MNPFKQFHERQKPIFDLARAGYEALFHLAKDDAEYVRERSEELYEPVRQNGGVSVGVHIRRGDWHAKKHPYEKSHLPLDVYTDAAVDEVLTLVQQEEIIEEDDADDSDDSDDGSSESSSDDSDSESADETAPEAPLTTPAPPAKAEDEAEAKAEPEPTSSIRIILRSDIVRHGNGKTFGKPSSDSDNAAWQDLFRSRASQLVIASDDAAVYDDRELFDAIRAQERVTLVSEGGVVKAKAGGDDDNNDGDGDGDGEGLVTGMEGGFSADAFWALGADHDDDDDEEEDEDGDNEKDDDGDEAEGKKEDEDVDDDQAPPSPETMRLRQLIGRSYVLDLAVLGGVASGVHDTDADINANTDTDTDTDTDVDTGVAENSEMEEIAGADAIVCAISAVGCRLLAVMMGYEDAFGGVVAVMDMDGQDGNEVEVEVEGRWVNVDKKMPWKGIVW